MHRQSYDRSQITGEPNNGATTNTTSSTMTNSSIDQYEYHHQFDNNNNNNNISHGAGRVLTAEEGEAIRDAYTDNIGAMTGATARMIEQAFDGGLTANEIILAIEETGMAERPTPWYLRAILRNWAETGVTVARLTGECRANKATKWWRG